jgi:hypothetical protein
MGSSTGIEFGKKVTTNNDEGRARFDDAMKAADAAQKVRQESATPVDSKALRAAKSAVAGSVEQLIAAARRGGNGGRVPMQDLEAITTQALSDVPERFHDRVRRLLKASAEEVSRTGDATSIREGARQASIELAGLMTEQDFVEAGSSETSASDMADLIRGAKA